MADQTTADVDPGKIRDLLEQRKGRMKACLDACASCTLCAESCFLFKEKDEDPAPETKS